MMLQSSSVETDRNVDTPDELLARAVALGPTLRQRAMLCEKLRRVPAETIADFAGARFFDVLKPRRHGGLELDPLTFLRLCIEVARHCGSSAWVLAVLGVHNWRLALFPDRAAADVWSAPPDQSSLIAASTPTAGTVKRVDGGYRLSGRWPFASGVDHSGWVLVAGKVPLTEDGRGGTFQYLFLVPRSDFAIEDNWHAAGLKGTGTNLVVIDDVFVPDYRASSEADTAMLRLDPASSSTGPLYRYPWGLILAYAIAAPAVGMALAAHDHYVDFVKARLVGSRRDVRGDPHAHLLIARNRTALDSVEAKLRQNFEDMAERIARGGELPMDVRARCRWEASWMTESCATVTRAVFEAMGATAVFDDHPVQRLFRDVHVLKAHRINNSESTGENFGRLQVGLSSSEPFL
jgi:3-hydroxy-9,10-secoandrosta-1,3,5(10)-triene-9,17-dione monooxygenase